VSGCKCLARLQSLEKAMGCVLLCIKASFSCVRDSSNIELAHLKYKKKENILNTHFGSSWYGTFAMLSCTTEILVGHEKLEDGWCIAINDTQKPPVTRPFHIQ